MTEPKHDLDQRTRSVLAYIIVIWTLSIMSYIVIKFGDKMEILTLMIGLVGGALTTVMALYFGGILNAKPKLPTLPGSTTAEVNITASTDTTNDKQNP